MNIGEQYVKRQERKCYYCETDFYEYKGCKIEAGCDDIYMCKPCRDKLIRIGEKTKEITSMNTRGGAMLKTTLELNEQELELIKMHIVHSSEGWKLKGGHTHLEQPDDTTLALLKKIDFELGEKDIYDPTYGYCR